MTARDRAAMNLHQSFGQRAGPQIAQLQSSQPRVPLQPSVPPSSDFIKQEDSHSSFPNVQDFAVDMNPASSAAINTSQTDGARDARDDWTTEYAQRKAHAAAHGADGDKLMRAHFRAKQKQMEGGGLLLSLDSHYQPSKAVARRVDELAGNEASLSSITPGLTRAQGDAPGDDDDDDAVDDEDAINSDLDDPDDLAANDADGENTDQVMLCTYDKVQRVKNKWKCTLKDGVLRVEGNE